MVTALQKVLPHSVLPRAPSPNSSSPNTGVRSSITQFIAASPDPSFDVERHASGTRTLTNLNGSAEASSSHTVAPSRTSITVTDAANRRGIARSTRILGNDRDAQELLALAQLKNGKIDVSFEASLYASNNQTAGKGKLVEREQDVPLFDVDLEAGNSTLLSPTSSRKGRLFPFASGSKDAAAPSSKDNPHNEGGIARSGVEDEDDEDYQDDARLLGGAASTRPGYFAPGDTSFGYKSVDHSQGGAVGFEPMTLHEGGWMVVSGIFVLALVLVAVLISIDVIDWPGDGIGRQ